MPKPPAKGDPDPMGKVVDRLLAQLPGLQGSIEPAPAPATYRSSAGDSRRTSSSGTTQSTLIGLWGRVALGLVLGTMITAWPYFRECGLPLLGYLLAVVTVAVTGGWIAVSAWERRNGVAHVLALVLLLWGLVLTAAELLPRIGYAATGAAWQCGEPGSEPSWMRWFGPPAA